MIQDFDIRRAKTKDLDQIMLLENSSNPLPWSRNSLAHDIDNPNRAIILVASRDDKILGYLDAWLTPFEASLCNIAVFKEFRRQHIAESLLIHLIEELSNMAVELLTLEVRSQNPAIFLYEKLGFTRVGLRKSYYIDDRDDAILMDLNIGAYFERKQADNISY